MSDGWIEHAILILSGSTALAILAHAVQTFPTPKNAYAAWLLGVVQYAVGQRERGSNTMVGAGTITARAATTESAELK